MAIQIKRILPARFELVSLLILTFIILFLGNSKALLDYYGLSTSTQVIQQSTQHVIGNGLSTLDGLSFTGRIVTFMIWAVVGVFCFSIVQSIGSVYRGVRQEQQLTSNRYIRPSTFTNKAFWRQVMLDFGLLLLTLLVTIIILYGLFAVILPTALSFGHALLFHSSLRSIVSFLFAAAIVYVWLLLLDLCLHLIAQRHQLVS